MNTDSPAPLASVLIITYKQEHLVGDTLRSVMAQKTSFPFEILVGDDASPDNTAAVCETIAAGDPRVRVIRHPQNLRQVGNFLATLAQARGRFVALVAGDDIWVNPEKLERQVTFLRDHPEYVLSHTQIEKLIHATGAIEPVRAGRNRDGHAFAKLVKGGNFITASSVAFDAQRLTEPERRDIAQYLTEDYPLLLTLAPKGKFHYVPEVCVRYRIMDGSLGRPLNPDVNKLVDAVEYNRNLVRTYCERTPAGRALIPHLHARQDMNVLRELLRGGETTRAKAFARTIPLGHFLRYPRIFSHWFKARFA